MIRVPFNCGDHKIDYMNLISYDEYRSVEGDKQAWLYSLNHDYKPNLKEFQGGFIFPQVISREGNEVKLTQKISNTANVLVKEGQSVGVPKYVQNNIFFGGKIDDYYPWEGTAAPSPESIIYIPEIDLSLNLGDFSYNSAVSMLLWHIDYGDNLDGLMEKLRGLKGNKMTISITSAVEVISSMIYSQISSTSPKIVGFSMRKGTENSGRENEALCAFSADDTEGDESGLLTSVYSTSIENGYIYGGLSRNKDDLFFYFGYRG